MWPFKKKGAAVTGAKPSKQFKPPLMNLDLGNDPLDPHGDGTIREGDPMFDILMKAIGERKGVIAQRNEDGTWSLKDMDDDETMS